ncbi:MAG: hypothetical protein C4308_05840 [Chitinophagaceae bacterium]
MASMIAGGIVLLLVDNLFRHPHPKVESEEQLGYGRSFIIGCWQVISMVPGISRSAATIIGGLQQKLTRSFAAEFSFLLAVPTMLAATVHSLFMKEWTESGVTKKGYQLILENKQAITSFITGSIVAFVVAMLAIRFFIRYLKVNGFRVFGIYRIVVGLVLLVLLLTGVINS